MRKLIRNPGLSLFLILLANIPIYPQLAGKPALKIHEKSLSEELRIRTDRELYAAGEKVWFKIYKLNSLTREPVTSDRVAYLDILDLDNNPVSQLKVEMKGFSGTGAFFLPDTLRSGNYLLRAYTSWMQNFPKDLFAYKTITVINPFDNIANLDTKGKSTLPDSVVFYPEGGHLVSGISSDLGIRVFGRKGQPLKTDAVFTDERNDTLSSVSTGYNGYGFTSIRPDASATVVCLSSADKNHPWKFCLPVLNEGIVLSAVKQGENSRAIARIRVSAGFNRDGKKIYLEVSSAGLNGARRTELPVNESESEISADDIPYGLSHFAVKDENGEILSDRWISRENRNHINFKINPGKSGFTTRDKIRVNITATDSRGNPVASELSVSVVKSVAAERGTREADNLRQLPGLAPVVSDFDTGNNNDYLIFFRPHDAGPAQQGINPEYSPAFLPEMEGHLISGNIRERISNEPLRNENITLSFVGKAARCLFTRTDGNGNFNFVTNEHGPKEIVIQPLNPAGECYVDLKNPFASGYSDYNHGIFSIDTAKLDDINNMIISMQINNIYEPYYPLPGAAYHEEDKTNFYGKPDNTIIMSKYISLTSVREIVAELIPGVINTKVNGKINFRMTKPYQSRPFEHGPLVMVDGVPVYDLEKVTGINSNDIEQVDVVIDRYYIAGNILDGILHFITKKGNLSAIDPDRSVFRMEYDMLQGKESFYSPDYSADSLKNGHLPDFRNTLYWNPRLRTDNNGQASVEFYSSDESMEYTIHVEGISDEGVTGESSLPLVTGK